MKSLLADVSKTLKSANPTPNAMAASTIAAVQSPARDRLFEIFLQRKDMEKFTKDFKVLLLPIPLRYVTLR